MTNEDLRQLAKDIRDGKVATHFNCESPEELLEVFTPLADMIPVQRLSFYNLIGDGGLIYEYYDYAIKQRISDRMPTFWFFHSLNREDTRKLFTLKSRFELDEDK